MQVRSLKGTIRAQDTIPRRRPTLVQTADQKVLPASVRRSCNPAGDISGSAQGIPLTVGILVLCDWVHSAVRVKHRRGLQRVRLHILALLHLGGIASEEEDGGETAHHDGVGGQRESRRPGRDRG